MARRSEKPPIRTPRDDPALAGKAEVVGSLTEARLLKALLDGRFVETLEEINRVIEKLPQDNALAAWFARSQKEYIKSHLVSKETEYNIPVKGREAPDLSETNLSEARRLYAKVRELGYTVERAIETLVREAKNETTGRASPAATEQQRPKITGNSPRRRKRYVFTDQELGDPDTIDRAYDTLADCEEKRRIGQPLSEAETNRRRWADAFTRRLRKLNGPG